jgi:all-trans-retinol 13,14-reductase
MIVLTLFYLLFTMVLPLAIIYQMFNYWKNVEKHCNYPKGYINSKEIIPHSISEHNIRDGYSKKKIPDDIDTIVIGSGIGGLTCAGLLSKAGKRVLVLEQHYIAGGCTHSFEDRGFEFDTGIHYIGNIEKRKKILDLITEPKIEWDQMGNKENGYCYDEIVVEDKHYYLRAGEEAFLKEVNKHYPEEIENVKRYLKYVKEVSKKDIFFNLKILQCRPLAKFLSWLLSKSFFKHTQETALEVVKRYTNNTDLQAFLLGQFGDYGKTPSQESFFLHASIVNHYLKGAWFPRGGSSMIAKNILPTIEKNGGRVLVRKGVKEILIANNKAVGVEMVNGDQIYAPTIISACGVPNTWKKLVPNKYVPKSIISKIDQLGLSCSFTYVFIGMEGTPEELELRSSNIWHWPNKDYDQMIEEFHKDPKRAPIPMFIGFPCSKDSTWNDRFPGKSNAVILTMAKFEEFEQWLDERPGKRAPEYQQLKKQYAERILEEGLYHYYPKTKGKITYCEVGSPLTFNHYIGSQRGECYGLNSKPIRFQHDDWLIPQTHIKGLYLTGQDITTLGVTGAMMAGVLTAHSVLGYGSVSDLISGRNLIEDIMHLRGNN